MDPSVRQMTTAFSFCKYKLRVIDNGFSRPWIKFVLLGKTLTKETAMEFKLQHLRRIFNI